MHGRLSGPDAIDEVERRAGRATRPALDERSRDLLANPHILVVVDRPLPARTDAVIPPSAMPEMAGMIVLVSMGVPMIAVAMALAMIAVVMGAATDMHRVRAADAAFATLGKSIASCTARERESGDRNGEDEFHGHVSSCPVFCGRLSPAINVTLEKPLFARCDGHHRNTVYPAPSAERLGQGQVAEVVGSLGHLAACREERALSDFNRSI
jgi:hypothetical protein